MRNALAASLFAFTLLAVLSSCVLGESQRVIWMSFNSPSALKPWKQYADGKETPGAAILVGGKDGKLSMPLPKPGTKRVSRKIALPAQKTPAKRWFQIELTVRGPGLEYNDMDMLIQRHYADGKSEWYERGKGNGYFAKIPATWLGRRIYTRGTLPAGVTAITVHMKAKCVKPPAEMRLKNVALILIDRGMMFQSDRIGNIFPGESGMVSLSVPAPQNIKAGTITLRDEELTVLKTIPLPKGQDWIDIPLPTRGYYDIVATATYNDGKTERVKTSATVVGPLIPEAERMKSRFGFNGCFRDMDVFAGARWDRRFVNHARIYKNGPRKIPAKIIPRSRYNANLTSVYCFSSQPEWLLTNKRPASDTNSHHFYPMRDTKGLEAMFRHEQKVIQQKKVKFFEVGNEYNCTWKGTPKELVEHHKQVYEAIKAIDPDTQVIGLSPAMIDMAWIKKHVDLGVLKYMDVLGFHPYVKATMPEAEFIGKVRELKAYMKSIGKEDMPLHATEFGWTIPPGDWQRPVTELTQGRYCSRSLVLLAAEEIDAIMYFMQYMWRPFGYSIANTDYTPRPAYAAYANTVRHLTNTTGAGKILRLTPTTYVALFNRYGKTVAIAWDIEKTTAAFIPGKKLSVRSLTGRLIDSAEKDAFAVSPSAIFAKLDDLAYYNIKTVKSTKVRQGWRVRMPWTPVWVPAELELKGKTVRIPIDAKPGKYTMIGRTPTGWQAVELEVAVLLSIQSATLAPETPGKPRSLVIKVRNEQPTAAAVQVTAAFKSLRALPTITVKIHPESTKNVIVRLPKLKSARQYKGFVTANTPKNGRSVKAKVRVSITHMPLPLRKNDSWDSLPVMDFSKWHQFGGGANQPRKIAPADCSATLQLGHDSIGIHARVVVRDDKHVQTRTPKLMWMDDSVQFAFDLDADKPWVANAGGKDGHYKVYEYGAALKDGKVITYRWLAYDGKLKAQVVPENLKAKVTRTGDKTVYEITFPWSELGMKSRPKAPAAIGFSMVVNDTDPGRKNGITLFSGIVDAKVPQEFGKLWILE